MIRVLIVDDSAVVRERLRAILGDERDMVVVGEAADAYQARELILTTSPDVLTLDVQMPRLDGLDFLRQLMRHHALPVVVLSSIAAGGSATALRALDLGAVEVVEKPLDPSTRLAFRGVLSRAIRAAARARIGSIRGPRPSTAGNAPLPKRGARPELMAIGASTGGIRAIEAVLSQLPQDSPPCVVVQHLPAAFTRSFAERLDLRTTIRVREARDGDRLEPGLALVAPGDHHMLVVRETGGYRVRLSQAPRVHHQRPSVDVLFQSVASAAGSRAAAALLTGMGTDGASGLLRIRQCGGRTVAESRESCVVHGMPAAAVAIGAASTVAHLEDVADVLLGQVPQEGGCAPAGGSGTGGSRHEAQDRMKSADTPSGAEMVEVLEPGPDGMSL